MPNLHNAFTVIWMPSAWLRENENPKRRIWPISDKYRRLVNCSALALMPTSNRPRMACRLHCQLQIQCPTSRNRHPWQCLLWSEIAYRATDRGTEEDSLCGGEVTDFKGIGTCDLREITEKLHQNVPIKWIFCAFRTKNSNILFYRLGHDFITVTVIFFTNQRAPFFVILWYHFQWNGNFLNKLN